MIAQIGEVQLAPESASNFSGRVDALFYFLVGLSLVMTALICALIMYFAIKYRRRHPDEIPRPIVGSLRLEIVWTIIPGVAGILIFAWGASIYYDMYRPPKDAVVIDVSGKQWMWKLQHPGGQSEINELHLEVDQSVQLRLISEDVIHSFYIPAFRVKQDALPGKYTTIWFRPTRVGTYHIFCAEYCGTGHSKMVGTVHVLPRDEYQRWLESRADGSTADKGKRLFLRLKCISCHNAEEQIGPLLEDIYGNPVRLADGRTRTVDDDYIRRSILVPKADVVAGYQPVMPPFAGQVDELEIRQLIAFIRSLGRGQTPPRVEATEPDFDRTRQDEEKKDKP